MKQLTAKASIQIQKSVEEVFESIIDPKYMSQYFIESSSGKMEKGKRIEWKFPEFDAKFPVECLEITTPNKISFDWSGGKAHQKVVIDLLKQSDDSTVVKIEEFSMSVDDEGINQLMRQTEGWANFLACLKAFLEFNINLRKGAFDFIK